jgi:hypothetical protein
MVLKNVSTGTTLPLSIYCYMFRPYGHRNVMYTLSWSSYYFPYFEVIKECLWDHLSLSLCLCIPRINFWMPEPVFMKLDMYIMAPEVVLTAYFIKHSHQSVCLCVYLPIVEMQRLSKHVLATMNTRNNKRSVRVVFYTVHCCISKEILWVCASAILVYVRTAEAVSVSRMSENVGTSRRDAKG